MKTVILSFILSSLPLGAWWAVNWEKPVEVILNQPETFGCLALIAAAGSLSVANAIIGDEENLR